MAPRSTGVHPPLPDAMTAPEFRQRRVCVRQRLSSEKDRYRGRRRVPTPARGRYAAVVTSAFVGAGVVALGATALPDAKAVDPSALQDLRNAAATGDELNDRAADALKASRDERPEAGLETTFEPTEFWSLPLENYQFTRPFGMHGSELHAGIDLSAAEGTPFVAVHEGTVKEAGWIGAYGQAVVIDHGDGTETVYGHASKLMVQPGQKVKTGDVIGLVGMTGQAYGPRLHVETHVNGDARDPIPFFLERGVDIQWELDSVGS
jgi:murein DD-endopeptidase MepM/ murein hydrolase activator NlpD